MNSPEVQKVAYLELVGQLKKAGAQPVHVMGFLDELHEFAGGSMKIAADDGRRNLFQQGWDWMKDTVGWNGAKNLGSTIRDVAKATVDVDKADEFRRNYILNYAKEKHPNIDGFAKNFFPDDNARADFYYNMLDPEDLPLAARIAIKASDIPGPDRSKALEMGWKALTENPTVQKYAPPIATALAVGGGSKLLGGSWGTSLGLAGIAGLGHHAFRQGMIPGLEGASNAASVSAADNSGAANEGATAAVQSFNNNLGGKNLQSPTQVSRQALQKMNEQKKPAPAPTASTDVQKQTAQAASAVNTSAQNAINSQKQTRPAPLVPGRAGEDIFDKKGSTDDVPLSIRAWKAMSGYSPPEEVSGKQVMPKSIAAGSILGGIIGSLKNPSTKDKKEKLVHRFRNALVGAGIGALGGAALAPAAADGVNFVKDTTDISPEEMMGYDRNFIERLVMNSPEVNKERMKSITPGDGIINRAARGIIDSLPVAQ